MTLHTLGSLPAQFGSIAALPLQTGLAPQLLLEDTANGYLYVLLLTSASGSGGVLSGVTVASTIQLTPADGPGPIYTGDFNGDGNTDFIVNGQTSYSATVYLGNGNGTFRAPVRYSFTGGVTGYGGVRSMLMSDIDGAKDSNGNPILDMVIEDISGLIEIHKGNGDGTYQTYIEGGLAGTSAAGYGGHLAAIFTDPVNPNVQDILTTTPIGMSLLLGAGGLGYDDLKAIYNIGPGRASFALADFYGTGNLDLAVDSPEGVAIVTGNSDGTFQTSNAYSALAPALGATVGRFRNFTTNPQAYPDVVVATGAVQGQLMKDMGNGIFDPYQTPTNPAGEPAGIPATLWSNIVSGDFNGDGNLDIACSLTGAPLPTPGSGSGTGLYVQFGNGDGSFQAPVAVTSASAGAPGNNDFYGESVAGDFNGDGISDLANIDLLYDDTLLGQTSGVFKLGLNKQLTTNQAFNLAAAGHFTVGASNKPEDLLMQSGATLIPYVNSGDGINFTAMQAITFPFPAGTILLTDMDGDGKADIVALSYNTAADPANPVPSKPAVLMIFYGNGDGTFGQPVTTSTPGLMVNLSRNYYLAGVADMNADGLPDIVLSDGSLLSILYNQGGRSFGTLLATGLLSSEQHFLAGQGINSISLADVNGDGVPDVVVANGGVTNSSAVVLNGSGQPSISLAPNPSDIDTGGITVLINGITTKPVTGTLAASPEPSGYQAAFTLTAIITPTAGVAAPTGPVQFYIDGLTVGSPVTLVPGATSSTAIYIVPAGNGYASGAHAVTALYSGDAANSPITLSDTHDIIDSAATTTTLYLCPGPTASCPATGYVMPPLVSSFSMYYGQDWNGTVVTTAADGGALPGSISIYDAYSGAALPPPAPLCTLTAAAGGACPASVGTTVGTSVGTNVITAVYVPGPADTHTGSTSAPVTITVLQDTTSNATLAGAPNPSPLGQPVTFTATLTGNFAAPTGPVGFYELNPTTGLSTPIGTGTLVVGAGFTSSATFTTTTLPLGTDSITASYAATQDFNAATFPIITETITASLAGSFTLSVVPTPVSVGVGYSALLTVTVTPQNGFSQGVNLSCANLPSEASCLFDSATLANGGGTTSLAVGTTAPHSCGTTQPYFLGFNGGGGGAPFALPALAGLLAIFFPRRRRLPGRRRWLRALLALVVVAVAMQATGCGNCTDLGTRPATYTFQVNATSTGTSEVQSQPVTITVTI
jgi:hypothetical protein